MFFSRHVESLIDNISVEINGVAVQNTIQRYNKLFKMLADYTMGDRIAQRSLLQDTYAITTPAHAASILHVAQPLQKKLAWMGWFCSTTNY
jgi:hypothetical protein